MDKLNVQRTWPPISGIKKTCENRHNRIHLPQGQTEGQKERLRESTMRYLTTENRDS